MIEQGNLKPVLDAVAALQPDRPWESAPPAGSERSPDNGLSGAAAAEDAAFRAAAAANAAAMRVRDLAQYKIQCISLTSQKQPWRRARPFMRPSSPTPPRCG